MGQCILPPNATGKNLLGIYSGLVGATKNNLFADHERDFSVQRRRPLGGRLAHQCSTTTRDVARRNRPSFVRVRLATYKGGQKARESSFPSFEGRISLTTRGFGSEVGEGVRVESVCWSAKAKGPPPPGFCPPAWSSSLAGARDLKGAKNFSLGGDPLPPSRSKNHLVKTGDGAAVFSAHGFCYMGVGSGFRLGFTTGAHRGSMIRDPRGRPVAATCL